MDFRGRAYPIPPHLNHLGNDLCRGLLQFEINKPLGERGLRWMKIHIANLYGFDKGSFLEREQFATENMENIHDSVDNPLGGKRWWLGAEDPWQCLATCFEISAAYRSGKPEEYESRLPVHQDGTCNGLQHYAALGGDLAGAQAVNLAPGDRPADVYTGVADRVSKLIEQDAEIGVHEAKLLLGKVGRKIVKQTVMTNVYGVTFIGAKTQIENRLKERDDIPPDQNYLLSLYLAKQVFASLGEMFHGARQIQDWLNDSAKRIAKSVPAETLEASAGNNGEAVSTTSQSSSKTKTFSARNPTANQMTSVIWTTPLGLPIVQPYRRVKKRQVSTILQTVFIENPDASCPVDAQKQSTAFPPNFIHSLDATHMLMSAVACQQHGLTFASVHDSYWTHACDVDTMNQILRDQFIELHSQPIIENLRNEFIERYAGYKIPVSNAIGDKASTAGSAAKAKQVGFAPEGIAEGDEDKVSLDTLMGPAEGVLSDEEDEDVVKAPPKKRLSKSRIEYTWEDLEFLPLPPKGEFDIRQVKDSHYFFH
ncbi:mitochondrial rna polymerase [Jimgerdemannia flammicorona]|uniref:DNA-directed RNA polymerase n=1 Tax=Jimgerdemannia flammicorona TaxID=994334 RepID=A0A433CYU2_9FUNG|nr:mitochondrial rna polymerase [Jimgerdemannia flammicorona]